MKGESFIRPDRRKLFEEHQRLGTNFDLQFQIKKLIELLHDPQTFAERMERQSLTALFAKSRDD